MSILRVTVWHNASSLSLVGEHGSSLAEGKKNQFRPNAVSVIRLDSTGGEQLLRLLKRT